MATGLSTEQERELDTLFQRAAAAQAVAEGYAQEQVDRLCRAVAWAVSNRKAFGHLVQLSIEEAGLGDPATRMEKRMKIRGILRDILRQKSVGIIEEVPEKGIVKYAKPVGIIGSIAPSTNPDLTPAGQGLFSIKARNAIIFSPHPRTRETTLATCEIMRRALEEQGAPPDLVQCITQPSRAMTEAVQRRADLVLCTAGSGRTKAALSSGTPAYGSGEGNATVIVDETADIIEACHNIMVSKTADYGSGCSADGNVIIHDSIFDMVLKQLEVEGGYFANEEQKELLRRVLWDENGRRLPGTVGISAPRLAEAAGFTIPEDRKFIYVLGGEVSRENLFSREKLTTLMALYRYEGEFENALTYMQQILMTSGRGHSVGIFTYNDEHIHRLGLAAPVGRIMVRQPLSRSNAGAPTNGMPMTSSLGCGTWGGDIVSENICLKHYMNTTWVARPIAADMPPPEELFGEFYKPELD